jgi:type IV pilus assembly protein PilQ
VRQVLIEARIVEADDSFGRTLGVKLGATTCAACAAASRATTWAATTTSAGGNYDAIGARPGRPGRSTSARLAVRQPAGQHQANSAAPAPPPSRCPVRRHGQPLPEPGAVGAGGRRQGQDRLEPARHHRRPDQGAIEQGEEIPYQQATSSGATAVASSSKASLKLEVTPQITPEGNVILNLDVNKDSRGALTAAGPPSTPSR